jgi:hypothetical protein
MTVKLRLTPEELAKSHDGLCGVAIGDGPCTCLVHWVERLQKEADDLKLEKRGFQIMSRRMISVAPLLALTSPVEKGDYERVGGDAECERCHLPYLEHPQISGLPTFHLTCSGKVVKT